MQYHIANLKKHQTPECLLMYVFDDFLNAHFPHFLIFSKKSIAHTKIIVCVLFYVNMLDQTQYSLFSPFLNIYSFKTCLQFVIVVFPDHTHLLFFCPLSVLT